MAIWGDGWFVGVGGLGLLVAAALFFTHSGPFQQCVQNGLGAKFCGDEAKEYCRDVSDRLAGRTDACNEILGEDAPAGSGQDPALNGLNDPAPSDPALDDPSYDGTTPGIDDGTDPYGDGSCSPYDYQC